MPESEYDNVSDDDGAAAAQAAKPSKAANVVQARKAAALPESEFDDESGMTGPPRRGRRS